MSRELNKDIFDSLFENDITSTSGHQRQVLPPQPVRDQPQLGLNQTNKAVTLNEDEYQKLLLKMNMLVRRVNDLENKLNSTHSKLLDYAKYTKKNFDKVRSLQTGFDQSFNEFVQQANSKLSQLSGRFKEKMVSDHQVQGLLDRHSAIVNSFEKQMSQMKQLVSKKDYELISFRSRLKDFESKK